MKFNEYIKMKNFSQQNFGLASAMKAVKSVPKKFKIFKENYKTASSLDKQAKEALKKSNAALSESAMHSDQYIKLHNSNNNSSLVKSLVNNPEAVAIMDKARKARNLYETELTNARNLQNQATAVGGRFFRFINPPRSFSRNKGESMKFNEYVKMKNFSEQQNFAVHVPGFLKNAGESAWNFLRKVPSKLGNAKQSAMTKLEASPTVGKIADANKAVAEKLGVSPEITGIGAGASALGAAGTGAILAGKKLFGNKTLKGAEGVFQKIGSKFTKGKGLLGSSRAADQAALGKKIAVGAAGGTALAGGTVYALAGSGNMDPGKYYIFDDQTGKVLGSSSGYASKAEAMADRNSRFQGGRINLGSTLAAKMSA